MFSHSLRVARYQFFETQRSNLRLSTYLVAEASRVEQLHSSFDIAAVRALRTELAAHRVGQCDRELGLQLFCCLRIREVQVSWAQAAIHAVAGHNDGTVSGLTGAAVYPVS